VTTILYSDKLELLKRSVFNIAMDDRNDYLDEFYLDNEGDLVFAKYSRTNSDNIVKAAMMIKGAQSDSLIVNELKFDKNLLDEIHIKVDNNNRRYFLTSFYYKQRRGNVEGFYFYVWDKNAAQAVMEITIVFSDELRREARGESNTKSAFNDYFIR